MASVLATYVCRILVILLSLPVLAGCVWMHITYFQYRNVIIRWKYRCEYALAGITLVSYMASFFLHRLGRYRTKARSDTYLVLGCILGALWLHTCLRIVIPAERQVLPVDYPYTDRDNIRWWSSYDTPNDRNLFRCSGDPNSRLGETLSAVLCYIDRMVAIVGVACGVFVILESCMSYSYDKGVRQRQEQEQQPYGDFALGYNPVHTTAVVAPPAVIVEPTPYGYGAHAAPPPPPPPPVVPVGSPYNPFESSPAYESRSDQPHVDGDKKTHGKF
ncbi:hypothetical protein BGZ73_004532 [Actinomortierella ambigua]|nr:hypothetical protein BGZ73_004532 [Actinomortierella ambigua]